MSRYVFLGVHSCVLVEVLSMFCFCSQHTVKIASCENLNAQRAPVGDVSRRVRCRETERLLSSQVCGLAGNGGIISLKVRTRLQDFAWSLSHVPGIPGRRFAGSPEAAVSSH